MCQPWPQKSLHYNTLREKHVRIIIEVAHDEKLQECSEINEKNANFLRRKCIY